MTKLAKIVTYGLLVAVVSLGYMTYDWYRFANAGTITKERGIFADPHLEIWIDVNARMPGFARHWACETLMARQAETMGAAGPEPYSCQKDFGVDDGKTMADRLIESAALEAGNLAKRRGFTPEQQTEIANCTQTTMRTSIPAELVEALNSKATSETAIAFSNAGREALQSCLAKIAN